jgi:hypothetical protein
MELCHKEIYNINILRCRKNLKKWVKVQELLTEILIKMLPIPLFKIIKIWEIYLISNYLVVNKKIKKVKKRN